MSDHPDNSNHPFTVVDILAGLCSFAAIGVIAVDYIVQAQGGEAPTTMSPTARLILIFLCATGLSCTLTAILSSKRRRSRP